MIIVAVFDSALGAYSRPWFAPTRGLASRAFRDEVNRAAEDNGMYNHPEDFGLHYLGTWDDVTGEFETVKPELMCRASDFKEK